MLNNLIFLGQIPGTNFQVTFSDIVEGLLLISIILLCRRFYRMEKKARKTTLPVQSIGHTSSALPADSAVPHSDQFVFPIPQGV